MLTVLSTAQFTTTLEFSVLYIALPSIAADLRLEPALAQWVVSAYAVLFAGFLVVGGRLTDRFGARRLFVLALVLFGTASAAGAVAGDGAVLLTARGAQGFAAALLQPAVLGLIGTTFPAGPPRARALAVWGSVGASGLAAGAILGGLLTALSWRLTFAVNVPLVLLCALGAVVWIRPSRDREPAGRIPLLSSVLGTGTALALVLGLTLGPEQGWDSAAALACLGLAPALLLAFVHHEKTARDVLIEPVLRRIRALLVGAAATACYMAGAGSAYYLLTLFLQSARGYSPLQAGLAFLPLALMVTVGSATAGRALRRFDPAGVLIAGFATAGLGLLLLALAPVSLIGLVISGLGNGIVFTSMFVLGTRDVPPEHHGTAGALLTTAQYLASALAVAVLTLVLGPAPADADFRIAFLLTAAAAAAGLLLVATQRRRLAAPGQSRPGRR
ncbi:MFS transporter [Amycolatopsis nigrescens]|uniref:MFS transporter n=1 Tax=Amycolatopsis nigrescens TaxID=381445 RepID=UPI0003A51D67|nr:MFS transporter [Amycolatopsis nigrescens]